MSFNPFQINFPFLNPLKTSENQRVFLCFQGEIELWLEISQITNYFTNPKTFQHSDNKVSRKVHCSSSLK